MLSVNAIDVFYGPAKALDSVTLEVKEGEFVSLLGSNGAGKSTLLLAVSGILKTIAGTIQFMGKRIDRMPPHKIVRLGIAHVPEGRQLFPDLTVIENLGIGGRMLKDAKAQKSALGKIYSYFPLLKDRKAQKAGTLSGGEQQMVAIARGLMSDPKMLVLDEPSLGLAPIIVEKLGDIIERLHKVGLTVLLVEQNANLALGLADRGYVLKNGRIETEGRADDLLKSDLVRKAYLGL